MLVRGASRYDEIAIVRRADSCQSFENFLAPTHSAWLIERDLGPRVPHPAVPEILSHCGGPAGGRTAGKRKLKRRTLHDDTNRYRSEVRATRLTPA